MPFLVSSACVDELTSCKLSRSPVRIREYARPPRERAYYVVRFVAFEFVSFDVHGGKHFFERAHLRRKVGRHGFSRRLVKRRHFVPKSRRVHVERRRDVFGFVLID